MQIIHATIPIQAEKREEFLGAVGGLIEASNNEEGVLSYTLYEAVHTPNEFLMVEQYRDQAAVDAHFKSPHLAAALGGLAGWVSGPPKLVKFDADEGTELPLG